MRPREQPEMPRKGHIQGFLMRVGSSSKRALLSNDSSGSSLRPKSDPLAPFKPHFPRRRFVFRIQGELVCAKPSRNPEISLSLQELWELGEITSSLTTSVSQSVKRVS